MINGNAKVGSIVVRAKPPCVRYVVTPGTGVLGAGWGGNGVEEFAGGAGFGAVIVDDGVEDVGYVDYVYV